MKKETEEKLNPAASGSIFRQILFFIYFIQQFSCWFFGSDGWIIFSTAAVNI
jgi:hypothetical protein